MKNKDNDLVRFLGLLAVLCCLVAVYHGQLITMTNRLDEKNNRLEYVQAGLKNAKSDLELQSSQMDKLSHELIETTKKLDKVNKTIADLKSTEYDLVYLGNFKITYYCDERRPHICGGNGVTASGKPTEVGWTAAADWGVLPKGSVVYIGGVGFREIQDVGGAVNGSHIDVLVQEHKEALKLGVDTEGVWLLVKKGS